MSGQGKNSKIVSSASKKDLEEIFRRGLKALDIELDDAAVARLVVYLSELKIWNQKMNLVAQADDEELIEHHFLDSLTLLPLLRCGLSSETLLDVGTGAGFPGLALKTARPELPVALVEPRHKRVMFLKHVIRVLKLTGVEVLACRLEDLAAERRFSHITSRALTGTDLFLEMARPFCPTGGKVICMKGPAGRAELDAWRQAHPAGPFRLVDIHEKSLPFSKAIRLLLVFEKVTE